MMKIITLSLRNWRPRPARFLRRPKSQWKSPRLRFVDEMKTQRLKFSPRKLRTRSKSRQLSTLIRTWDLCKLKTVAPLNIRRVLTPLSILRRILKTTKTPTRTHKTLWFLKLLRKSNTKRATFHPSHPTPRTTSKIAMRRVRNCSSLTATSQWRTRSPEVSTITLRMETESSLQRTSPSRARAGISHSVVTSFMDPKEDLVFADLNRPTRNAKDPRDSNHCCSYLVKSAG